VCGFAVMTKGNTLKTIDEIDLNNATELDCLILQLELDEYEVSDETLFNALSDKEIQSVRSSADEQAEKPGGDGKIHCGKTYYEATVAETPMVGKPRCFRAISGDVLTAVRGAVYQTHLTTRPLPSAFVCDCCRENPCVCSGPVTPADWGGGQDGGGTA
jgi:hypothetical protein